MDFRKHMVLDGVIVTGSDEWITIPFLFKKDENISLKVMARTFNDMVLAYVVT